MLQPIFEIYNVHNIASYTQVIGDCSIMKLKNFIGSTQQGFVKLYLSPSLPIYLCG